jgi:hypothetical protein
MTALWNCFPCCHCFPARAIVSVFLGLLTSLRIGLTPVGGVVTRYERKFIVFRYLIYPNPATLSQLLLLNLSVKIALFLVMVKYIFIRQNYFEAQPPRPRVREPARQYPDLSLLFEMIEEVARRPIVIDS